MSLLQGLHSNCCEELCDLVWGDPKHTIYPETITELICSQFLRCRIYVAVPEINSPRSPTKSPEITVRMPPAQISAQVNPLGFTRNQTECCTNGTAAKCRQRFVRARGPQNWNPEVFDQTRCSRTFACRNCAEQQRIGQGRSVREKAVRAHGPLTGECLTPLVLTPW